eukprot:1160697-Pelagomonas_calceolata.AAC.6
MKQGTSISMHDFTDDLRNRSQDVWRHDQRSGSKHALLHPLKREVYASQKAACIKERFPD